MKETKPIPPLIDKVEMNYDKLKNIAGNIDKASIKVLDTLDEKYEFLSKLNITGYTDERVCLRIKIALDEDKECYFEMNFYSYLALVSFDREVAEQVIMKETKKQIETTLG